MMRIRTAWSATIRAMCSISFSCSRIFTASEGASRCSWSLHRFRVLGVMFMSLQMSEADRPPSCCWTARIRASLGWCLCAMLGVFLVVLVLL